MNDFGCFVLSHLTEDRLFATTRWANRTVILKAILEEILKEIRKDSESDVQESSFSNLRISPEHSSEKRLSIEKRALKVRSSLSNP